MKVAELFTNDDMADGRIFPRVTGIREVSAVIAAAVA